MARDSLTTPRNRRPHEVDAPLPPRTKWHGPKSTAPPAPYRAPRRSNSMQALEDEDLLPVIVFIFLARRCDDAVHQLRRDGLLFTSPDERREIELSPNHALLISRRRTSSLEYADFVDALRRGIAGHHAGMVPAFREIVETCFE